MYIGLDLLSALQTTAGSFADMWIDARSPVVDFLDFDDLKDRFGASMVAVSHFDLNLLS